MLVKRVN